MKAILKLALSGFLCFLITENIEAQFELSGEFRPRTEYSHGYNQLALADQNASLFTSQRTRLNFIYSKQRLKTKISLQDVRLWGAQQQLVMNEDFSASLHEAWLEYEFLAGFSLKAGRQELAYNDHRILGNVGWAQQARSHDLFLFKYENKLKVHLGIAYNENSQRNNNIYNGPDAYKAMQFLWINKNIEFLDLNFLLMNNGPAVTVDTSINGRVSEQKIVYSQTFGSLVSFKNGNLKLNGSLYFQTGKDVSEKKLNAFYSNLEVLNSFCEKYEMGIGYEILSGTDFDENEKNNSFTPFYGTNHKFNGFMDYFYTGNHINNVGLNDLYLKAEYNLGKLKFSSAIHFFNANAAMASNADSYLGTELDLGFSYKFQDNVSFNFGYSQMFAGESMEMLKGGSASELNNWMYVMLTIKPVFLKID